MSVMVHPSLSYKIAYKTAVPTTYCTNCLTITEYLLGEKGMIKEEKNQ